MRSRDTAVNDDIKLSTEDTNVSPSEEKIPGLRRYQTGCPSYADFVPRIIYYRSWRSCANYTCSALTLITFWFLFITPKDCTLIPGVRPPEICGYTEEYLLTILQLDHGFSLSSPRYFYEGEWIDYQILHKKLNIVPHRDQVDLPPCIVVSLHERLPCVNVSCIFPLYLRKRSKDLQMVREWIESLTIPYPMLYNATNASNFSAILDGGAGIGLSTITFAILYPHARIVAVEASEANFRMLRLNTFNYPNVIPLHGGLWNVMGQELTVHSDITGKAFESAQYSDNVTIPLEAHSMGSAMSLTVPMLMRITGCAKGFDFVKLDIEGSEKELLLSPSQDFENDLTWTKFVRLAIVYIHEVNRPGSRLSTRRGFPPRNFVRNQHMTYIALWNRKLNHLQSEEQEKMADQVSTSHE